MATLLDLGLLESFSSIFVWLFVFVLIYGIMEVTAIFKNKGLHALIALSVAIMLAVSPNFTKAITLMVPWFVILAIVLTFVLMAGLFAGFKDASFIMKTLGGESSAWWLIIIAFVIVLYAMGGVFGQGLLPLTSDSTTTSNLTSEGSNTATSSFSTNVAATLFHPKVLGMIVILLISTFAVALLGGKGG